MATHTGSAGLVKVGSNTAAEIRSFTLDTSAEVLEDTTLGDTSRTYQIGKKVQQYLLNVGGTKLTLMDRLQWQRVVK